MTVVTSSKMDANFLAAGSREARGSLFKTLTRGSGEKLATDCGGRARDAEGTWSADTGSRASRVSGAIGLGEPPEPPQRRLTGPCTQIVPSLRRGICRRQTAQGARVMLCLPTGDSLVLMLILVLVLCVFILGPQSSPPESQKPAIKRTIIRSNHSTLLWSSVSQYYTSWSWVRDYTSYTMNVCTHCTLTSSGKDVRAYL